MGGGGSPTDAGPADAADGSVCDPDATPPDTARMGCFQSSYCPPAHSASAHDQLSMALGLCDTSNFPCCQETIIDEIPCGPSASGGDCCYTVFTRLNQCNGDPGSSGGGGGPPGCLPNGQSCNLPTDCCSEQCNAESNCGPILCRPEGSVCFTKEDCCELSCIQGPSGNLCYLCIDDDQPCSDAGVACCSGTCAPTGLCQPVACAPDGELDGYQGEACCTNNVINGYCAPQFCAADGAVCTSIYDCCSVTCNDYRCGEVACTLPGEPCSSTFDCCIDECNAGTCGLPGCIANGGACENAGACAVNPCLANIVACTEDADCCSGHCVEDICSPEP